MERITKSSGKRCGSWPRSRPGWFTKTGSRLCRDKNQLHFPFSILRSSFVIIFLSHIFLFRVLSTGKCGTEKYEQMISGVFHQRQLKIHNMENRKWSAVTPFEYDNVFAASRAIAQIGRRAFGRV